MKVGTRRIVIFQLLSATTIKPLLQLKVFLTTIFGEECNPVAAKLSNIVLHPTISGYSKYKHVYYLINMYIGIKQTVADSKQKGVISPQTERCKLRCIICTSETWH